MISALDSNAEIPGPNLATNFNDLFLGAHCSVTGEHCPKTALKKALGSYDQSKMVTGIKLKNKSDHYNARIWAEK